MRRIVATLALLVALLPALGQAQAPGPVPALPDTERRTSYTLSASTCACSVGFQLLGDGTDVDQWIEVWLGGVRYLSTDPTFGWTLTSASGPLATIPRPITNAVLTFNTAQTGTVQIVGARRPRRTAEFAENRGVAARDHNQILNDIEAQLRELWDWKSRVIATQPGNVMGGLPPPAACQNLTLGFDNSGLNPVCMTPPAVAGVRLRLTSAAAYYIDPAIGSSSGPGTTGAPFDSLPSAWNYVATNIDAGGQPVQFIICSLNGRPYPITITTGLTTGRSIFGAADSSTVTIQGCTGSSADIIISTTGDVFTFSAGLAVGPVALIRDMKLTSTGGSLISAYGGGTQIQFSNINFGAAPAGFHIGSHNGAIINKLFGSPYTISGGALAHVSAAYGGIALHTGASTITCTGAPSFSIAFADSGFNGVLSADGLTFSGCGSVAGKKFNVHQGGMIQASVIGTNLDYLPGNIAGTITNGGVYDQLVGVPYSKPGGRLTPTSATPVQSASIGSVGQVFYTPYAGGSVPIDDGGQILSWNFSELGNVLSNSAVGNAGPAATAANKNYDMFVWESTTVGPAFTFGAITGGSGYSVPGNYTNVPLTGSATGSGATANITVAGGAVTAVAIVNVGINYVVGDTLTASNANLGGAGSGFSVPLATVIPGTLYLTRGPAWTNDTTRGYTLTSFNGLLLNPSDITNGPKAGRGTYVGTIRTDANGQVDWNYGYSVCSTSGGTAPCAANAVTMTIASPAVVSWTAHGLQIGSGVTFTSTGALPTGIAAAPGNQPTQFYVCSISFGANSFELASTPANAIAGTCDVNTSGSQSGTHAAIGITGGSFGVWNNFNRVRVTTTVSDFTGSWTLTDPGTPRPINNSKVTQHAFVTGLAEDSVEAAWSFICQSTEALDACLAGIGVNWNNGAGFNNIFGNSGFYTGALGAVSASYRNTLLGWNTIMALEGLNPVKIPVTATFFGRKSGLFFQNGLQLSLSN